MMILVTFSSSLTKYSFVPDTEDASETEVCKQEEEFNEKKEQ